MTDRHRRDRNRFDRQASGADRDIPHRAGDDVRSSRTDRPYPDRDYSGISDGYTGGHAEDRSVHRHLRLCSRAGSEGVGRTSVPGLAGSRVQWNPGLPATGKTGSLRRRSATSAGGTGRSRTRT
jgi:hypothetical protein